ncbi:MAG: acetyl-CoA acetyltransferase [Sphingomonadaceae bacterium]
MSASPERIPVIVGVGQINDRPDRPEQGLDSGELMIAALRAADADAGGGWLADINSLALVSQLSWPQLNPLTEVVARGIGAAPAHLFQTALPNGDSPILLLNEAANRIGAGEATVCAVSGGEALRTAAHLARARAAAAGSDRKPNALRDAAHRRTVGYRQSYGLTVPVDVYPLYENAGRAAYGQSLAQGQAESGAIWERFAQVAAANPSAWIRTETSAHDIVTANADNRPIAFPYTKLQVANSSVNQGAAFLVTSLAEARRRGVPDSKLAYVGAGAAAHESDDFLERDRFDASASMAVSLTRALELNGVAVEDIDHAELYSCFPCVPKMARRVIGWPLDRPATVFGGLTFGGGPIGNYMSHAVACMVGKLRAEPRDRQRTGLLFANGGYATHNHTIVLTSQPNPEITFPQAFDYQAEADAARGPVPELDKGYLGPATIETYTVHYGRQGEPRLGTVVARTPAGKRTLAAVLPEDAAMIAFLTDGRAEPVGTAGEVVAGAGDLREWRRS